MSGGSLQDQARVLAQFGTTDAGSCGGGSRAGGRTNFEGRRLNEMLDLIESANPEDLESAGNALWKARDGLKEAARELEDYVTRVEWKGEAASEFRRFGVALADHATQLSGFADAAGTQITVAGTGLASVRSSRPERDGRFVQKRPDDFELPERTEGNQDYQKALKVEKDRQEAINQMNRLASFYAVSEQTLAGQEPPKFPEMLKADVPPPKPDGFEKGPASGAPGTGADASGATGQQAMPKRADASGAGGASRADAVGTVTPVAERNTSMEIDSVAAPPAPTTGPGATPTPSATGAAGPAGGQVPPMAGGFVKPVQGGAPRPTSTSGRSGGPGAGTAGRPGAAGGGSAAPGRAGAAQAVGRPGAAGSGAVAAGRAGAAGAAGQAPAAGRPGTVGHPTAGRAGTGGSAGPRTGRADGIVGGTPQRAASGAAGSRLPRGNIIGGDGAAPGRASAARPGQSGAIGANQANGAPRSTGRGTPSSNGVVGTPRSGVPGSRPAAGGFTAGGAGFVGGRPGRRQSNDEEQERTGSTRPDYLTEDEETWSARRRGSVPPVID